MQSTGRKRASLGTRSVAFKTRKSAPTPKRPVYFSTKTRKLAMRGGKGRTWYRESRSPEFEDESEIASIEESKNFSIFTIPDGDAFTQGVAVALLEAGFSPDVHPAIRAAVCRQSPFESEHVKTLCIRGNKSKSVIDGAIVYNHWKTPSHSIYEVLFMATNSTCKKRGIGRAMVECLKRDLARHRCADRTLTLCVSLKSNSSEAASFWEAVGMQPVTDDRISDGMVGFDDFAPYSMDVTES